MLMLGPTAATTDVQHKIRDSELPVAHPLGIGLVMGSFLDPKRVITLDFLS